MLVISLDRTEYFGIDCKKRPAYLGRQLGQSRV